MSKAEEGSVGGTTECPECNSAFGGYYALGMHLTKVHGEDRILNEFGKDLLSTHNPSKGKEDNKLSPEQRDRFKRIQNNRITFGKNFGSGIHIYQNGISFCGECNPSEKKSYFLDELDGKFDNMVCPMCQGVFEKEFNINFVGLPP